MGGNYSTLLKHFSYSDNYNEEYITPYIEGVINHILIRHQNYFGGVWHSSEDCGQRIVKSKSSTVNANFVSHGSYPYFSVPK